MDGGGARRDASGLRLALFSGNYNYTRDGANQALNRLVAHLLSRGAAVRVYSPTARSPAFDHAGDLVSTPSMPIPGRPEYRLGFGLTRAVRSDLARFRPTAVHVSAPDLLGFQARRWAARGGLPVVASLHTRFETYFAYYGLAALRPAAERYLAAFYGACDRVLAPNRAVGELLSRQAPSARLAVWSRGVDRALFSPSRRDMDWRRANGFEDGDVAVLFLGRLVREKGLDEFVAALEALSAARRAPVKALVVGEGPARPWLQAQLPQAVFTGFLSGEVLARAVASADILLNPSRTETFGNVTLEAMSSGLPVICPEAPSTRELVTAGSDGLVIDPPSPQAYAAALRSLIEDPALRRRMGEAARGSSQRYDWWASCEAVLDVYREVGAVQAAERQAPPRQAARVGV